MFILREILNSLALFVSIVATILTWLLIARAILSWVRLDPYHPAVQFLHQTTEPILAPFRRLPLQIGMLDLSLILAIIAIQLVRNIVIGLIMQLTSQM